jgi:mono/diheme cytochrome c family protein
MQQTRFLKHCRWTVVAGAMLSTNAAYTADIEAGKAIVAQQCAECHRSKDWSGETTAALESLIKDVVAGKVKHSQRKLSLSPQESADIAAYWTSGRK